MTSKVSSVAHKSRCHHWPASFETTARPLGAKGKKFEKFHNVKNVGHSPGSYANPVNFFFKISPDHLNIDMSWRVRMIETIKQPLETLFIIPWKWPIWVILHCKNCISQNFPPGCFPITQEAEIWNISSLDIYLAAHKIS